MDLETFEKRFADMLDRFDDSYDKLENYKRNAEAVEENMPNASDDEKRMYLVDSIQRERTNNLVRVALKEFLVD